MSKGGTKAPVGRKSSGFVVGDTVSCTLAASSWHAVGRESVVVPHPRTGLASVEALDGHFDEFVMVVSKFEKVS